jgi:hypothetical protein
MLLLTRLFVIAACVVIILVELEWRRAMVLRMVLLAQAEAQVREQGAAIATAALEFRELVDRFGRGG